MSTVDFDRCPTSMDDRMAPFVRAGRAAFGVVLEGYIERLRPASFVRPDLSTVEFAEIMVSRVTDLRRGLDYLETRPDIDKTRHGGPRSERRLGARADTRGSRNPIPRASCIIGAGLPGTYRAINAAANPINFAPHIRAPKLIVQGRYDEDTPLRTAAEPLFKLFAEPKQMTLFDGGHVPSIEVTMSATRGWLDANLGRVVR